MSNRNTTKFLDLVQTYSHQEASPRALFGQEGTRMGFRHGHKHRPDPAYQKSVTDVARFLDGVKNGSIPAYRLQEAMSTSDFPTLFGDIIDRQILGNYAETRYTWSMYAKRKTVSDFRTVKRFTLDGAQGSLDQVGEGVEYPEGKVTDGGYSYSVAKYGKILPFTWESQINDDLNALSDIPERLGRAARRTEEKFATTLFANNTTFFTVAHKNVVSTALYSDLATGTNPVFSNDAVGDALNVLGRQVDADGEPIPIEEAVLVVPPALEVAAQNFINSTQVLWNNRGGSTIGNQTATTAALTPGQTLMTANWMARKLKLAINYYLPIVDATHGNTGWYVFASPEQGRPAMEMGFLRGHESPETFMKEPNQRRVGGGGVNPIDGDFDNDNLAYKVRHVLGGAMEDFRMAVYSNGSGS